MAEKYIYERVPAKETGFPIVSCTDRETGVVVRTLLASEKRSYASTIAYIGAKFSRSREGLIFLASEVEEAYQQGVLTPEGRLASIVNGLKHQSPAGMAHVAVAAEEIPIATTEKVLREMVLYDGQAASTRFIEFGSGNGLPELKNLLPKDIEISVGLLERYKELETISLTNYTGWFKKVYEAYRNHFQIDLNNKKEAEALTARSYDTVRGFLLSGFKTSMILVTNATAMQQIIGELGADRLPGEKQLADALLALLRPEENIEDYVPEIKPLLKHTEPNLRTKEEQIELKRYLGQQPGYKEVLNKRKRYQGLVENSCDLIGKEVSPSDQVIAQEIVVIHPSVKFADAAAFAAGLNDEQKAEIGRIIFSHRDRFYLPAIAASSGTIGLDLNIDYGIKRDLGRHRAWERVSPAQATFVGLGEIPETGFTQAAYLREIPELEEVQKGMEGDMKYFYEKRDEFLEELNKTAGENNANRVGMYLLPLAHQMEMIMNGDIRYMVHLQDIRIRPGVHIDARRMIASANLQVAKSDPLYRSLKYPDDQVLVDDRQQFINRD
jgi:hypothetical protein